MTTEEMKAIVEGLLFVTGDEGMTYEQLAEVMELELETIKDVVGELETTYQSTNRGLQMVEVGGAFRLATKAEHADYMKKLATSPLHSGLSQAALETLAIVAYKQPITRVEIDEIRGVKSERALHSLNSKLLIKEVGRQPGTGRPILYGTTRQFLDHFGLKRLDELPPLPEDITDDSIEDEADLFFKNMEEVL
ncbi:SMC-Scp complex subunit ScpB [Bacillus sp. FJAT-45037]|uniref:SMC-Scp complex subunit ScpB n=1 Tax=Bacillus sp. FJAT-45037 TaxID=2011007 RepID=UPI000C2480F3|nr:SMC-Scp complex subunit ScpB [Bacillus sp. FJAT-45037]